MVENLDRAIPALRAYAIGCARMHQWTDLYTHLHQRDVATHAVCLALEYGLEYRDVSIMRASAELHDVGKIPLTCLLQEVSTKVLEYDSPEMELIRSHPVIGAMSIEAIATVLPSESDTIRTVARIVRHHHERWDGKGYPDGLSGTAIPLLSRILAVCDAAKSMTSPERAWRAAMPVTAMLEELRRCSGAQFAPDIVDLYCTMIADNRVRLPHVNRA